RRRPHVGGWNADEFGEPAGIEIGFLERPAHGLAGATAVMAFAAWDVMRSNHTVARGEAPRPVADLDDVADHLVTEDGRWAGGRVHKLGDVRAAKPAAAQAEQQLTRAGLRPRKIGRRQTPAARQEHGPHATRPKTPFIQQRNAMAALRRADSATRSSNTRKRRASISWSNAK